MSATDAFENALLGLILTNVAVANVGDASGLQPSATAGVFYISLHTASPGEVGNQGTNETAYTDYARVSVARSVAQWTVTAGVADNDSEIAFPVCGASGSSLTHYGLGSDASGSGNLNLYGSFPGGAVAVSEAVTPKFAAGALDISLD